MDGAVETFTGVVDSYFSKLYSPEKAQLLRRAYAAAVLGRVPTRAPFGKRGPQILPVLNTPTKIAENATRERALLVYVNANIVPSFIFSSGPGPAGGGSDYIGNVFDPGDNVVFPLAFGGVRRFVLFPSEELWLTQITPPLLLVNISTEVY